MEKGEEIRDKKEKRGLYVIFLFPFLLFADIPLKKLREPVPINYSQILTEEEFNIDMCEESMKLLGGRVPLGEGDTLIGPGIACHWVIWGISGTRINWRFKKPGVYASNGVAAVIVSNGDIFIDFEGFEKLINPQSVDPFLETFFGFTRLCSNEGIDDVNWIPAEELNYHDILIQDGCFWWRAWRIWNKIVVKNSNSAGEYEDDGMITLTLMNTKMWLESSAGRYNVPLERIPAPKKSIR